MGETIWSHFESLSEKNACDYYHIGYEFIRWKLHGDILQIRLIATSEAVIGKSSYGGDLHGSLKLPINYNLQNEELTFLKPLPAAL